jgi:predicted nuclease with TOPRIM domain
MRLAARNAWIIGVVLGLVFIAAALFVLRGLANRSMAHHAAQHQIREKAAMLGSEMETLRARWKGSARRLEEARERLRASKKPSAALEAEVKRLEEAEKRDADLLRTIESERKEALKQLE